MSENQERSDSRIEKDMRVKPVLDTDKFATKVFKQCPLVGDLDISEKTFEKLYNSAKTMLDARVAAREFNEAEREYSPAAHEQMALVVVCFAKKWNSNEESKFTRYVASQFGYRDDSGRIWGIITESLEKAFCSSGRLFIVRNGDRQFFETIMVHSIGPGKTWFSLYDLLFDFYVNNLEWEYIPHDPIYRSLIDALNRKFKSKRVEDDSFLIASKYYSLRIGIRRLVQERPEYSAAYFEGIIRRLHSLIKNETTKSNRYSLNLLDEWFANRISTAGESARMVSGSKHSTGNIALDYSGINIRYSVSKDHVIISVPAFRLLNDCKKDAEIRLFMGNALVQTSSLEIYGNELGKTVRAISIVLKNEWISKHKVDLRVEIACDGACIYSSAQKLYRSVLVFADDREIGVSKLRPGRFLVFAPETEKLSGTGVEMSVVGGHFIKVNLKKGYSLEYCGNVLSADYSSVKELKVIAPEVVAGATMEINGEDFPILSDNRDIRVYHSLSKEAQRYRVILNGQESSLADYEALEVENGTNIHIDEKGEVEASIIDIVENRVLFRKKYYVLNDFSYSFKKEFYITQNETATIRFHLNGLGIVKECPNDERVVSFPYKNGEIQITIPRVWIELPDIEELRFGKYLYIGDISKKSHVVINNDTNMPATLLINDVALTEKGKIRFSDICTIAESSGEPMIPVLLCVGDRKETVFNIVTSDSFIHTPLLTVNENKLCWDGGIYYVGDKSRELSLVMKGINQQEYSFSLKFDVNEIADLSDSDLIDGDYVWNIISEDEPLSSGKSFIGNEKRIRFSNKKIEITRITQDIDGSSAPIIIKPVFIDQIKYVNTEYINSEGDVYDVYSGIMYRESYSNGRIVFSKRYTSDKYKVNPVKIIYISNRYLRIVNSDDEGIYCFYNYGSNDPGYEVTDIEPGKKNKNYLDILFYEFNTEDIKENESDEPNKKTEASVNKPQISVKSKGIIIVNNKNKTKQQKNENFIERVANAGIGTSLRDLISCEQDDVIKESVKRRLVVNAGPGTGKTYTLIEKVIYMVEHKNVPPEEIQILCFSRAAVEVIRLRIQEAIVQGRVDEIVNGVDIRTFDSFVTQFLYWVKESDYEEIGNDFKIESLNYDDRIRLFTKVITVQPDLVSQCSHLVVDEVQDLVDVRAEMVIRLINALPQQTGVTLLGDACQAIYDYQVQGRINSRSFYDRLEERDDFIYCSFSHNYRQTDELQELGEKCRTPILNGNLIECEQVFENINHILRYYELFNYGRFDENALKEVCQSGRIGILTRSNAQALQVDYYLRKINVDHVLQRRLESNALNAWIAYLFNSTSLNTYDNTDFVFEFVRIKPDEYDLAEEIWAELAGFERSATGRISIYEILFYIRSKARDNKFYLDERKGDIVVSTIHRSKGREYDSVIVSNKLIADSTNQIEEERVRYVAITRAKSKVYLANLPSPYFRMIGEKRRCISWAYNWSRKRFLSQFEVGKEDDFDKHSFCEMSGVQEMIREEKENLINKEVYLKRIPGYTNGYVIYYVVLKDSDVVIGRTSQFMGRDLDDAIKQTKNLPWNTTLNDYMYPDKLSELFIADISSEIAMARGNENDVTEFESLITWNVPIIEGYAKTEFVQEN